MSIIQCSNGPNGSCHWAVLAGDQGSPSTIFRYYTKAWHILFLHQSRLWGSPGYWQRLEMVPFINTENLARYNSGGCEKHEGVPARWEKQNCSGLCLPRWKCLRTNLPVFLCVLMSATAPGMIFISHSLRSSGFHFTHGAAPGSAAHPRANSVLPFRWFLPVFQASHGELWKPCVLQEGFS